VSKKTNLNTIALHRSWRTLVLLPLRRCRRPLCSPYVVGGAREGVSWMVIASYGRRLGGGVAKGAPESDETAPSGRYLWSSRARRDAPPPPVAASRVVDPHGMCPALVDRASASADAAAANTSPARCAESWKSSIIARCCSCVGWVPTGGLLPTVYHRSRWWCRGPSRPTKTPALVSHQCCSSSK
jgi:hypothetical protein